MGSVDDVWYENGRRMELGRKLNGMGKIREGRGGLVMDSGVEKGEEVIGVD